MFWEERDLDQHLEHVSKAKRTGAIAVDHNAPQLNQMLELKIGYVYDITDCMRQRYLKLGKNEVYDGITFIKCNKEQGDE